jgi:hypothetical protein
MSVMNTEAEADNNPVISSWQMISIGFGVKYLHVVTAAVAYSYLGEEGYALR